MLGTSTAPLPATDRIGRLNVDQYYRMIEIGIIKEGAPYELLDGLLVIKDRSSRGEPLMSIGEPHSFSVGMLVDLNAKLIGRECFMRVQCPIRILPDHSPEPDGAIVRGARADYFKLPPMASDLSCVIEVADSSLKTDRDDKGAKYAGAAIPQFILINLVDCVVEVYESPDTVAKKYTTVSIKKPGDEINVLLPNNSRLIVKVLELLRSR